MRSVVKAFLAASLCVALAPLLAAPAAPAPAAVTPDGGRYYGALVAGKLHGQGRMEWDNGARYAGGFANGLYSGRGRMRTASGDVYVGEFRDGLMSGQGRLATRQGGTYVGQFRNDLFNGRGRYKDPSGESYEGSFKDGRYHGHGHLSTRRSDYTGEFKDGEFSGQGEIAYPEGRRYRGQWERGMLHGKGRFESANGDVYEGDFRQDEFTGRGAYIEKNGARHEGAFLDWRPHGAGRYTDARGNRYEGNFVKGEPSGIFRLSTSVQGLAYEGEVRDWRLHGDGVLRLPNGDVYRGRFENGNYHGEGTLTLAKPGADGSTRQSGNWRYGSLVDREAEQRALVNVETALYNQRALLDRALSSLSPRQPGRINLYLLAIAGDGSQEVFRREVEFVQQQFDEQFGTRTRSVALINSRNTVASAPMATLSSVRESLKGIAARMDKEQDILFLFMTSHGSEQHELYLNQQNMRLRGLKAGELREMLNETGIRWKVVVVSACYGGGFIDAVKDDHTLVIAAARHDRRSFGCSDANDFTYFGRAYFKEALPRSTSFEDAFRKAEALVREWETTELKGAPESELSLPQISNPAPITEHLGRWWSRARTPVRAGLAPPAAYSQP